MLEWYSSGRWMLIFIQHFPQSFFLLHLQCGAVCRLELFCGRLKFLPTGLLVTYHQNLCIAFNIKRCHKNILLHINLIAVTIYTSPYCPGSFRFTVSFPGRSLRFWAAPLPLLCAGSSCFHQALTFASCWVGEKSVTLQAVYKSLTAKIHLACIYNRPNMPARWYYKECIKGSSDRVAGFRHLTDGGRSWKHSPSKNGHWFGQMVWRLGRWPMITHTPQSHGPYKG